MVACAAHADVELRVHRVGREVLELAEDDDGRLEPLEGPDRAEEDLPATGLGAVVDEPRPELVAYGRVVPAVRTQDDHLLGRDVAVEQPVDDVLDGGGLVGGVADLRSAALGPAGVGRDLARVELEQFAMDRLGGAAVRRQFVRREVVRDREHSFVDALVVVEEEPDRRIGLVAEREPERVEPVVVEVLGLVEPASFLSGNGPLVEVLQDALESRVFVRDLHAYIRRYGIQRARPEHNVIVFDEAQRAWDADYMHLKRGVDRSEPDLLIDAGGRMPRWSAMVGLVGEGQEIYTGEEGGLAQWADAIRANGGPWDIHCPPRLAPAFAGLPVAVHDDLDLTISLRSRRAEKLHFWVSHVLRGDLDSARRLADEIRGDGFPLWLTRDLSTVGAFTEARYEGEPGKLFGYVASSQAKNLARIGLDNTFQATKRVKIARWFNDNGVTENSGRALQQPITEFQCQGLELDLPVVLWGDDYRWDGPGWALKPVRRRVPLRDPDALLVNSYRVLLTRGRDELLVVVPRGANMDRTAAALQEAGIRSLPD
jgi:schlafen family protein